MKKERGLHELYGEDPERADNLLWERRSDANSGRGFLKSSGLTALSRRSEGNIGGLFY